MNTTDVADVKWAGFVLSEFVYVTNTGKNQLLACAHGTVSIPCLYKADSLSYGARLFLANELTVISRRFLTDPHSTLEEIEVEYCHC
jgi:hypothetical protein